MAEIDDLQDAPAAEVLNWAITEFGDLFGISTSFQYEGMVLIDMAARISSEVRVVTLDTGRLPEETYDMMETVRSRYGVSIEAVSPQRDEVEAMVTQHGANLFYCVGSAAHAVLQHPQSPSAGLETAAVRSVCRRPAALANRCAQ